MLLVLVYYLALSISADMNKSGNFSDNELSYQILIPEKRESPSYYIIAGYKDARISNIIWHLEHSPLWESASMYKMLSCFAFNKKLTNSMETLNIIINPYASNGIVRDVKVKSSDYKTDFLKYSVALSLQSKEKLDTIPSYYNMTLELPVWLSRLGMSLVNKDTPLLEGRYSTIPFINAITDPSLALREGFAWANYVYTWESMDSAFKDRGMKDFRINDFGNPNKWQVFQDFNKSFSTLRLGVYRYGSFMWMAFYLKPLVISGTKNNLFLKKTVIPERIRSSYSPSEILQYQWIMPPEYTDKNKNLQQALSSTGVCAYFFHECLTDSVLASNYVDADFYRSFLPGNRSLDEDKLKEVFSKYHNVRLKLYAAFYMLDFKAVNSYLLHEFVWHYSTLFPEDEKRIKEIYHNATGYDFSIIPAQQIKLTSDCVLGGYGLFFPGTKTVGTPHSFNLNAATYGDLKSISGIRHDEIVKLLEVIDNKGIKDFKEIDSLGLSSKTVENIKLMKDKKLEEKKSDRRISIEILKLFSLLYLKYNMLPFAVLLLFLFLIDYTIRKYKADIASEGLRIITFPVMPVKFLKYTITFISAALILLLLNVKVFSTFFYLFVSLSIIQSGISFMIYSLKKKTYPFKYKIFLVVLENATMIFLILLFI
ncbi:MAG: hypothetical protein JXA60_02055 [Candidatus Coatesbacteria bacterium]|nr:hypothetical protein [Candidatus Coatesbacteria bacterium]